MRPPAGIEARMKLLNDLHSTAIHHPRWTLVLFALLIFGSVTRGDFSSMDTQRRLQVTHWLWTDQPQIAEADRYTSSARNRDALLAPGWCELRGKHGETFAQFGLGQALIMLPADILSRTLIDRLPASDRGVPHRHLQEFMVHLSTFPVIIGLSLILSFQVLRLLGFGAANALAATMLLALATSFLVYTQVAQENSLMYLCYVAGIFFLLRSERGNWRRNLFLAGACAGFSLLIKLTDIVYLAPLAALAVCVRVRTGSESASGLRSDDRLRRRILPAALYFGLPVLAFVAADRWYNYYRFGEVSSTYMKQCAETYARAGFPSGYPFGYDRLTGFLGPLIAPDRSIVLFDPWLLGAVVLLIACWRRLTRTQMVVAAGSVIAFFGLAAALSGTYFWTGGPGDWGPRHHMVPVEVICLLGFALMISQWARFSIWQRAIIGVNIAVAMVVQFAALPLSPFIEFTQTQLGDRGVVPLMRVRNIYHLALGDFDASGLSRGSTEVIRLATHEAFLFLPLRVARAAPRPVGAFAIGSWLILIGAVAAAAGIVIVGALRGFGNDSITSASDGASAS
jgi:Dolichyl-phosphate-mannose-protein mannosyltransferase